MIPESESKLTDPSYISQGMFDSLVRTKFFDNPGDAAMRDQALKLFRMVRASKCQPQIIVDILHASKISKNDTPRGVAEIGFAMGVQFGFELGLTYARPK